MAGRISKTLKSDGDVIGPITNPDGCIPYWNGADTKILASSNVNISALITLTNNSLANALHRHSELVASDGNPDPALSVGADGKITIYTGARIQRNLDGSSLTLTGGSSPEGGAYFELSGKNKANYRGNLSFWVNTATAYVGNSDHTIIFGHYNGVSTWLKRLVINKDGNIGIGIATPATSALLDLTSTAGALLLTRMTTAQKNALTAVNGMLLYDSTLNKFQGRENGAWGDLGGDGIWTDDGTYYKPNNWADFKIYDSGRLDLAGSKWVYDDDPISYTGIGCGVVHKYNQLIKNFSMNDASNHQVLMRIEGKTTGSKDVLALMTAIQLTSGTGQGWGMNPMIDISSGWAPTSDKWAIGCEIDVNNRSSAAHGKSQGLMIVGVSSVAPTVAMTVSMGTTDWKDGIWLSDISDNGIVFLSNPAPGTGIRFDYPCSNANFWQTNGDMKFHDPNAGTKTLSELASGGDVVNDTSPELGGNLYTNAYEIIFNNNKALYMKNSSGSSKVGLRLNAANNWEMGMNGAGLVLGYGCSDNNPLLIRVGGTNNKQVLKSVDTDSQGKHYLVVT